MNFGDFEDLLRQAVGLDSASVSPSLITRAIQDRMRVCGVTDTARYGELLTTSKNELQELIEAIIVPETWFFRNPESFAALAGLAVGEWATVRPGERLRFLSLPCSTGEEPYSMAMALLDAGLPPYRFRVDAIDISLCSLERARAGVYGKNSFRGLNLEFRDRYFEPHAAGWQLAEKVLRQVHFEHGNLIDAELLPGVHTYDAIFCRNVLIYFAPEAQARVVETLARLLTPEGMVFMGPSETGLLLPHRFVSARLPHTFAFRKISAAAPLREEKKAVKPMPRQVTPLRVAVPAKPRPIQPVAKVLHAREPQPVGALDEVMRLADQGHWSHAAERCEAHVRQAGPSARAYYLLGLIRDAGRQPQQAIELYRKALYLDPQNEEVLAHLSALLKSQGDIDGARLILDRIRRLPARKSTSLSK